MDREQARNAEPADSAAAAPESALVAELRAGIEHYKRLALHKVSPLRAAPRHRLLRLCFTTNPETSLIIPCIVRARTVTGMAALPPPPRLRDG